MQQFLKFTLCPEETPLYIKPDAICAIFPQIGDITEIQTQLDRFSVYEPIDKVLEQIRIAVNVNPYDSKYTIPLPNGGEHEIYVDIS